MVTFYSSHNSRGFSCLNISFPRIIIIVGGRRCKCVTLRMMVFLATRPTEAIFSTSLNVNDYMHGIITNIFKDLCIHQRAQDIP